MNISLKKHRVLIGALFILWGSIFITLIICLTRSGGNFSYVLDDAYIHMSIAKNIAEHGTWGVHPDYFASASSSMGYSLFLALIFFIFGANVYIPFIIGFISVSLVVILMYILFLKLELSERVLFIFLVCVILFTPLPSQVFTGMEHPLQMIFDILFFYYAIKILTDTNLKSQKLITHDTVILLILSPLVVSIRYEGLFLVGAVCFIFFIKRKFFYSIILGGIGIAPILLFGLYSISQGGYLFPNPVLVKTSASAESLENLPVYLSFIIQLGMCPQLYFPLILSLIIFLSEISNKRINWNHNSIVAFIYLATTFLHLLLARIWMFFRYEAYLVLIGFYISMIFLKDYIPILRLKRPEKKNNKLFARLAFIGLVIMTGRGVASYIRVPYATVNIYEQQIQMGLFLDKYYNGQVIAANDIGAISYFSNATIVDLMGLSSQEVTELMLQGNRTTESIRRLCIDKNVKIAMVYDFWFNGIHGPKLPSEWKKVGEWEIIENLACMSPVVSFYAVDPAEETNLRNNLIDFNDDLPARVIKRIY
jgi:hypothetical protein